MQVFGVFLHQNPELRTLFQRLLSRQMGIYLYDGAEKITINT